MSNQVRKLSQRADAKTQVSETETEIRKSLEVLNEPDSVFEIRVFKEKGIASGYFDDFEAASKEAAKWSGRSKGVYFTLNPVQPTLRERSANRISTHVREATSDTDVVRRRWLFIDFDPVRKARTSSTDGEHERALQRARDVRQQLSERGWPEPLLADSGNGAHLLYRIALANDEVSTTLIRRGLEALDLEFSDDEVEIDRTTFNASRVCRLYGTLAAKGVDSPERPHRISELLDVPNTLRPVSRTQLVELGQRIPEAPAPEKGGRDQFDVESYIATHNLTVARAAPWNGGRKWVLNPCPFDPEHRDNSAYIVQFPNGAVAAGCHHNGCAGKNWHDLRDEVEGPGWRTVAKADKERRSQAAMLLEIAHSPELDLDLFHTPDQEPFVTFRVGERRETWPVGSDQFKRFLGKSLWEQEGKTAGREAMQGALEVLKAEAQYEGIERPVYTRLAEHEGAIYLDLGDPKWRVVEIKPEGWKLVDDAPVRFRRPRAMMALPEPIRGGSLSELREFLNAPTEEIWVLVLAWLVGAMNPNGPHSILAIYGEQGTAKSTMAKTLRSLIDPAKAPIRAMPAGERDLMISAKNGWVIAFDNVSGLNHKTSDALCRLASGAGYATRRLYSNDGEEVFEGTRPIILNGIEDFVSRPDLGDRILAVNLPPIPEEDRRAGHRLQQSFKEARPGLLGALLDAVSAALRNRDAVNLEKLPRMADFARWVVAAEEALPWPIGTFMRVYGENQEEIVERALEESGLAIGVRRVAEAVRAKNNKWSGTPTKLFKLLDGLVERHERDASYPSNPAWLSRRLQRVATFLRRVGISVELSKPGKTRLITIKNLDPVSTDDGIDGNGGRILEFREDRSARVSRARELPRKKHKAAMEGGQNA